MDRPTKPRRGTDFRREHIVFQRDNAWDGVDYEEHRSDIKHASLGNFINTQISSKCTKKIRLTASSKYSMRKGLFIKDSDFNEVHTVSKGRIY